ncbi:Hypothetical predicted protein, partial [Drosophila guanche]
LSSSMSSSQNSICKSNFNNARHRIRIRRKGTCDPVLSNFTFDTLHFFYICQLHLYHVSRQHALLVRSPRLEPGSSYSMALLPPPFLGSLFDWQIMTSLPNNRPTDRPGSFMRRSFWSLFFLVPRCLWRLRCGLCC